MRFLLPFLILPLVEIAGFAYVGDQVGALNTVLLVILAAVVGILLLKRQGLGTLKRAQERMDRGEPPLREAFDGLCIALAGVLLVIPGFVTDILALLVLLPPVRGLLYGRIARAVKSGLVQGEMRAGGTTVWRSGGRPPYGDTTVIDGDFREVPQTDPDQDTLPPPDSRWRPPGR